MASKATKRDGKSKTSGKPAPKDLRPRDARHIKGGDGAVVSTTLTNLANMRHETLKGIANNLRG